MDGDKRPDKGGKPPVVREYGIGTTKYIVTAKEKTGASEDAAAKVRRLIAKDIAGSAVSPTQRKNRRS